MLKRLVLFTLALCLTLSFATSASYAEETKTTVFLNGKLLTFDVPPTIVDGSTLVPLRKIFEELGATIEWNGDTRTVTAVKGDTNIVYKVGNSTAIRNQETLQLSVPGQVIDGSTMVPLRFVSEALGATVGWEGQSQTIVISSAEKQETTVSRVVDGDTIEVDWNGTKEKLRLIGVDTPESVHPDATRNVEEGKTTSAYTKEQLEGKKVWVELDVEERDRYGRLLGYVYQENGMMYNVQLMAEGYAQTATFPPNVRWVELFKSLQTDARDAQRGLWAGSKSDTTQEPPVGSGSVVQPVPASASCDNPTIKGNLSSSGEKIYHSPGQQYYERTDAEEMFCTAEEAEAAGYRASKR